MPGQQRFQLVSLPDRERFARFTHAVRAGLLSSNKSLPCAYLYDRLGSALFAAICELPEYYPTRAETSILQAHAADIIGRFPPGTDLVELGSGNAAKTRLLIDAALRRHSALRYLPLDIEPTVLEAASLDLVRRYPGLEVCAVAAEYADALRHLDLRCGPARLVLWLGSNIGNLERGQAAAFLSQVRAALQPGDGLLVGIDLRKDRARLEAAYDDPCGVTAAFNRNLLARINRELGGRFDLRTFQHRAAYDADAGRVEMHLVSDRVQRVPIAQLNLEVAFAAGEPIHTESSYKYSVREIDELAAAAGLRWERSWPDAEELFTVNLLRVE